VALLLLEAAGGCCEGVAVVAVDNAADRFFADFDIEILHSVERHRAALPKPHLGHQAGGAGSRSAITRPELTLPTLPLQSRPNASPFWIMLLLSLGTFEREIIEVESRDHVVIRILAHLLPFIASYLHFRCILGERPTCGSLPCTVAECYRYLLARAR
jgi:hypothetical protein